ncbi:MAG TPA: hypothetical protein VIL97_11315 [Thermoanaerobaculia bacterium]
MNSKRRIARWIAVSVGALLSAIGALHDVVNIRSVIKAIDRGDIAERLAGQLVANVAASGLALILPGVILLMIAAELERGNRAAARVTLFIATFLFVIGVAGYWWQPIPSVFIFSLLGVVLATPLLVWRKHFLAG